RPCVVPGENAIMKDPCHCPASPQGRIRPPSRDLSGGTADTKECNAIEKRRKGRECNLDRAMDLLKELLHPLAESARDGLNGMVYSQLPREASLFFTTAPIRTPRLRSRDGRPPEAVSCPR